ncbi:MAG TPA: xanthine dehydrogenase family protein subunit M [Alphaproteobacteria bacterium]|nr:xanthine dehydrogenase family protein subunit M [Alphaproteobacteria bacterium]
MMEPGAEVAFHRPRTVQEALALLSADDGAVCLAGGATLVAMMNADLIAPSGLVSLSGIDVLRTAERLPDGAVRIGAMRHHRQTADETLLEDGQQVVREAARQIANTPVRNMGTIGGSIAFFDPAADYPPALVAADAIVDISGPNGDRAIAAAAFFVDWYETALGAGEMVTGVRLPAAPMGSVGVYHKLARVSGDFATASVALVLAMENHTVSHLAVAVGACAPTPVRRPDIEAEIIGNGLDDAKVDRLADALAERLDPVDDVRASAAYRRLVAPRMVKHALCRAAETLGGRQ